MRYRLAFVILSALAGLGLPNAARAQGTRNFCAAARQHVAADFKLSDAVRQVFGEPSYALPSQQDAACIYPLQVLRYGSADVLLTMGNEPGQACHGCSASLSAYFLAQTGGGEARGGASPEGPHSGSSASSGRATVGRGAGNCGAPAGTEPVIE